jgi:hypothetical protein
MATAKKDKAAGAATEGLRVVSRPATFRRAGINFSAEPRVIPLSELTDEQVAQIEGEINLVATRVPIEPEPKPA